MTQREIDIKIHDLQMYIADKFRDIQIQSTGLKNIEDRTKNLQTLLKITDFVTEIQRAYDSLDSLENEIAEEPVDDSFAKEFLKVEI